MLNQEKKNAKRMEMLAPSGAAAQSQLDIAIANVGQAEADVAARKADIARAKLNLEYASIRAPISGRIGRALVTEGALVGQNSRRMSPQFSNSIRSMRTSRNRPPSSTNCGANSIPARCKKTRPRGCGSFSTTASPIRTKETCCSPTPRSIPGTGQVTLRGEFPNPNLTLLPGMYVRVQIVQGIDPDALAVPQQAVRRNNAGGSEVFLVRDDNRASLVPVRLGHAIDDRWLILDGVKPGDRVIVDGFQKFIDGDVVRSEAMERDRATRAAYAFGPRPADSAAKLASSIDVRFLYRSA